MDNLYSLTPAQIVIHSTQYCPDCLGVKAFFETNNIRYLPVFLEEDHGAAEFVMKLNDSHKSVPTIAFPDGSILVEPDWGELRA